MNHNCYGIRSILLHETYNLFMFLFKIIYMQVVHTLYMNKLVYIYIYTRLRYVSDNLYN